MGEKEIELKQSLWGLKCRSFVPRTSLPGGWGRGGKCPKQPTRRKGGGALDWRVVHRSSLFEIGTLRMRRGEKEESRGEKERQGGGGNSPGERPTHASETHWVPRKEGTEQHQRGGGTGKGGGRWGCPKKPINVEVWGRQSSNKKGKAYKGGLPESHGVVCRQYFFLISCFSCFLFSSYFL